LLLHHLFPLNELKRAFIDLIASVLNIRRRQVNVAHYIGNAGFEETH